MAKPCIYCGNSPTSKEHVWGKWTESYFIDPNPRNEHFLRRYTGGNLTSPEPLEKGTMTRPGKFSSQTLRIACEPCNNGWMSVIEEAAIPVLGQMLLGYWGEMTPEKQLIAARWLTLKTMSWEMADWATAAIPESERIAFRTSGRPSHHWHMAIGYADVLDDRSGVLHRKFRLPAEREWHGHREYQATAFVLGRLAALTVYTDFPLPFGYPFEGFAANNGLVSIWHPPGRTVQKPFRIHDLAALEEIMAATTDAFSLGLRVNDIQFMHDHALELA